jgi:mannitol-specific phosphotransferase system IIBC component
VAEEDKDDTTSPVAPTEKPVVAATEEKPETLKAESTSVTAQTKEAPTTEKKGPNWIILTALIGLGVAAAGVAIFKKTV